MPLIAWTATIAACATPEGSEPAGVSSAVAAESVGTAAGATPEAPATGARRGGRRIDSDELVGLGELGLLPSLLNSLGTGSDCDFDDALSTCQ